MPNNRRIDYYTYISSPEWRTKANAAKQRAGNRCQVCNRPSTEIQLDAHHRTYERLGHEPPEDITVLCRGCHELYERSGKIPKRPAPRLVTNQTTGNGTTIPKVRTDNRSSSSGWYISIAILALCVAAIYLMTGQKPVDSETPSPAPIPISTPTPNSSMAWHAAATAKDCHIRVGPGRRYGSIAILTRDTPILVAGFNDTSGSPWYCVKVVETNQLGWISCELVSGEPDALPYVRSCNAPALRNPVTPTATRGAPKATPDRQDHEEQSAQVAGCSGGCTTYPSWCPGAPIKGNVSFDSGERIYHVLGQEYYDATKISPAYGERWFCTEAEAQAAGWRKALK